MIVADFRIIKKVGTPRFISKRSSKLPSGGAKFFSGCAFNDATQKKEITKNNPIYTIKH